MKQFRQGDIFFQEVSKLPKNLLKKKDPIIAHGEVTGHSHRVSEDVNFDNVDMYDFNERGEFGRGINA
jgi:hypothetical protein